MKNKLFNNISTFFMAAVLTVAVLMSTPAKAQDDPSTNAPIIAQNPFTSVLQSTILDTNSTFFASPGIEIRALTETTLTSYQSVISGTYYFTNGFGVGAEVVNGAANVVDQGFLTIEYGYGTHNIKLVPLAGIGYDLYNRSVAFEIGSRLEVAVVQSGNMYAETDYILEAPLRSFNTPVQNTFRLGIGFKLH